MSTYPSRGTSCRWARLKDLGRLISNLWICHDWWGTEWVGVGICGRVLLKHTQTYTINQLKFMCDNSLRNLQNLNKEEKKRMINRREHKIIEWTHIVSVHLLHLASHVGHHVVKHTKRVPHHVLHKHKRKRTAKGQRGSMARLARRVVTRHYQLINNTIMCTNICAMSTVCLICFPLHAIWDTATRTFTFYHNTKCDPL